MMTFFTTVTAVTGICFILLSTGFLHNVMKESLEQQGAYILGEITYKKAKKWHRSLMEQVVVGIFIHCIGIGMVLMAFE